MAIKFLPAKHKKFLSSELRFKSVQVHRSLTHAFSVYVLLHKEKTHIYIQPDVYTDVAAVSRHRGMLNHGKQGFRLGFQRK